jgi:hypothetical protein
MAIKPFRVTYKSTLAYAPEMFAKGKFCFLGFLFYKLDHDLASGKILQLGASQLVLFDKLLKEGEFDS